MAAKVGLVLALDKEKEFSAGLKSANEAVKQAKLGFEAVKEVYDGNANSSENLARRMEELVHIQDALNKKLDAANAGRDNANAKYQEISEQLRNYREEADRLRTTLAQLEAEQKQGTDEYRQVEEALKDVTEQEQKAALAQAKQQEIFSKWSTALTRTNKEIRSNNREMEKTTQYMDEAATSADHCAISLDKFGNEVRDIGKAKADAAVRVLKKEYDDYKDSLSDVNDKARELNDEMVQLNAKNTAASASVKAVDIAYSGEANTVQALTAKQKALSTVHGTLAEKSDKLSESLSNSNETIKRIDTQLGTYKGKIKGTEEAMSKLDTSTKEGRQEFQKMEATLGELKRQESEVANEKSKHITANAKLQTEIAKVNTDIEENNRDLKMNGQYLDEAKSSANGCASSIDAYGRSVKEAGDKTQGFGDILEEKLMRQFSKEVVFDMAIDALRRLGQAAIDATKKMITVGMEYNAQMQKVKAISGSTNKEMEKLDEVAQSLGRSTVFTATEVGEGMQSLALAGWKTKDIISGIPGVLNLASSSSMDLAQAAEYVSDNVNAFGEEASYASRLSDIMAYAMSNSSQTAEDLGEAYKKVAASAHAYGFTEEEVTSVLMVMANSGKKGSEAGAALNTVMTRLAVNTKDCADAIAEVVGHEVVYNKQTGEMRSLTEILTDLGSVWDDLTEEQQNNLTYVMAGTRQSTALRTIMASLGEEVEGTGKTFAQYKEELEGCTGAAQEMADVSLDSLQGDVTILNSALEGLGISLERKLDGTLRSVVQGVTDIINGITDDLNPQKDILDQFIEDIQTSNEEVDKILQGASKTMSQADLDVTQMEYYRDLLVDLSEKSSLTELEQYQVKDAIEKMSDAVPEVSTVFDEATRSITASSDAINDMFANAEGIAMRTALIKAQSDSYEAYAQAKINVAMAESAQKKAAEERVSAEKEINKSIEDGANVLNAYDYYLNENGKSWDDINKSESDATKALDDANNSYKEASTNIRIQKEALKELGDQYGVSLSEAEDYAEGSKSSIDEVNNALITNKFGASFITQEQADEAEEATQEIVDAYKDMEENVRNSIQGCIDMMSEWNGGEKIDIYGEGGMIDNLQKQTKGIQQWKDDMGVLASKIGTDFTQEMYDSLAEAGPKAANQVRTIAQAAIDQGEDETGAFTDLAKAWGEAMELDDDVSGVTSFTSQGQAVMDSYAEGLELGLPQVQNAVSNMQTTVADGATKARDSASAGGTFTGNAFGNNTASAINSSSGAVSGAASSMVANAKASAYSATAGVSSIGSNIVSGIVSGLYSNSSFLSSAATSIINTALAAMRNAAKIQSPSKVFKNEVGKYIALGVAFGIKDNASLAGKQAAKMSDTVLASATTWLAKYKKTKKTSLEDEKYYWTEVLKHVKKGTTSYTNALAKVNAINKQISSGKVSNALTEAGFTAKKASEVSQKISSAFNVSWYSGTGKSKKKKEAETYYSDVLSAAEKYAKNQQILNNWSIRQEIAYWNKVKATLKTGSQAWYDAYEKVTTLTKEMAQTRLKNQQTVLDYYKTYANLSAKAEMQYWNTARKQFASGTAERIEADQKYLEAKENYYSQLEDLDNEYEEKLKDVNDTAKEKVQELTDTYNDAVKSRKEEILGSLSIFEAFDTDGYTPEKLIDNLYSQVDALTIWETKLSELKNRGISDELYDILTGQGVGGAANVYSISQMTDEQLEEYERLLQERSRIAQSQAVKDNHDLLMETNKGIEEANAEQTKSINEIKAEYTKAYKELTTDITTALNSLPSKVGDIGEEALASLFKKFSASEKITYNSNETIQKLTAELGKMVNETGVIGEQALQGLMDGMIDRKIIESGANTTINMIKKAMEDAADIHSPSRLFRDAVGKNIGLGIAEGIDGTSYTLAEASKGIINDTVDAAQREYEKRQQTIHGIADGISVGGVHMLNELMGTYNPQTVVNVNNTGLTSQFGAFLSQFGEMMQMMANMKVVLDSGETVGALADGMNVALADIYAKNNRGRK